MDPQISILFYVGVITPTVVTIGFFIGFLICWYRCDLRTHLLDYKSQIQCTSSDEKKEDETEDRTEKASEHSVDSAIDLNELEVIVADDTEPQLPSLILPSFIQSQLQTQANVDVSKLGVDSELARGSYPSQEKLCDEINSEPRIYESSDDLEMTWSSSLASAPTLDCIPTWSPSLWHNSNTRVDQQPLQYSAKPLPTTCKPLYGKVNDNHPTDYGLAMLNQSPNPVCGEHVMYPQGQLPANETLTSYQYPYTYKHSANIAWKKNCSFPVEIIHV